MNVLNATKLYAQDCYNGTSLVVHWLRLLISNLEGAGSIPGQGIKIAKMVNLTFYPN